MAKQTKSTKALAAFLWSAALLVVMLAMVRLTHGPAASQAAQPPAPMAQPAQVAPGPRELIGLNKLEEQMLGAAPTGFGVVAGHVEGMPGDYMPRVNADAYRGVNFVAQSGASKQNGHANATARIIYGPRGLAPGITNVQLMTIADFLGSRYLRVGSNDPPVVSDIRLFNHSWVVRNVTDPRETLLRADYAIDDSDVVMVVGVDNGANTAVPAILASAYNVIAVGQWHGRSSGGYTTVDGVGRCKPDIVAPGELTSFSTPVVAAMVARLQEAAERLPQADEARKAEVIKAVLLAGAGKPANWKPAEGKPLDEHFGAGRANLYKSHAILMAGPPEGEQLRRRYGWRFAALKPGQTLRHHFHSREALGAASLVLTWHRRVQAGQAVDLASGQVHMVLQSRLADLDVRLIHIADGGREQVVAESSGTIDNVEHIFRPQLQPGRYAIEVTRKDALTEPWDFALAWRIETAAPATASAAAAAYTP